MSGNGDQADGSSADSDNSVSPGGERKSGDFSISAILSDNTGGSSSRKKRGGAGYEHRSSSGAVVSSPSAVVLDGTPHHVQKSGMSVPLSTPSRFTSRLYPSPHPASSSSSSHLTPSATTPNSHWVGPLNQSVSLSPFNIGLLLPLSPSPSSAASGRSHGRLDLDMTSERESEEEGAGGGRGEGFACDDSLGMLSTVAVYHSEMSCGEESREGGRQGKVPGTNSALSVGGGMARMRLESSADTVETTLGGEDVRRSTPPPPHPPSPSYRTTTGRGKGRTPSILKRDRKRPRQLADSFPQSRTSGEHTAAKAAPSTHQPPSSNDPAPQEEGYLSPTSAQKSPRDSNLSFSPSIFLSQPANSSTSYRKRTVSGSSTEGHADPVDGRGASRGRHDSESDYTESMVAGGSSSSGNHVSRFVTSTPIKQDKENTQSSGLQISPTYLSPGETEVKRPRLKDVNPYETSSGSDSEAPPVVVTKSRLRSQAVRHRSRARAQLSPLLENACSPIAKTDQTHRPPSSLLTANFPISSSAGSAPVGPSLPTAPLPHSSSVKGSTTAGPYHQIVTPMTSQPPPPVSFPYLQTQHPTHVPFPFSAAVASAQYLPHHPPRHPQPNLYMGHVIPSAVTTCAPLFSVPVSPLSPPNAPYFIAPPLTAVSSTAGALFRPPPNPFYYSSTPHHAYGGYPPGPAAGVAQQQSVQRWGSSPLSTQIQRTGQIQSVPPWFIFEQNRPEGKRLRLTEAINRSLSETPSHNPKLPVGWTKYACGQTDDQIQLTHRARLFLQSGRRQLTFDNINT